MTTTRKLTIAAVVLLACVAVVALVVRRPAHLVTVSLVSLSTNSQGIAMAWLVISNANPHEVRVNITLFPKGELGRSADIDLQVGERRSASRWVRLPAGRPCRVLVEGNAILSRDKLAHRIRRFLAARVSSSFWPQDTAT